jgi:DNA repair ATPase RecN
LAWYHYGVPPHKSVALRGLTVSNFQSLAEITLELGQLTVIVGPSNSGKSAVVRALQAALFNRSGGEFVRESAEKTQVVLQFDGGTLRWLKPRKGGAEYSILQGESVTVLTRVGKQMPPEIEALTGVREIQIETLRARLQFASQFDEPFLLAGTGGQAAKLLAKLSKLDVLVTAQVLARRDVDRTRRVGTDAEGLATELRDRLADQPDYEALLARWEALQERAEVLAVDEKRVRDAQALAAQVQRYRQTQAVWAEKRLPERTAAVQEEAELVAGLAPAVSTFREAAGAVESGRTQLETASASLKRVEEELHDVLAGLEVCPVCGRPM